jgi:hypothetical protein
MAAIKTAVVLKIEKATKSKFYRVESHVFASSVMFTCSLWLHDDRPSGDHCTGVACAFG